MSQVFLFHAQLGKELERFVSERHFLSKEFKKKKCVKVKGSYKPRSKEDATFRDVMIFWNKDTMGSFDPFPCQFRGQLEEVMLEQDSSIGKEYTKAYYNVPEPSEEELAHLKLSSDPTMTEFDRFIVMDFNHRLLEWMKRAIALAMSVGKRYTKLMKKEYERICKIVVN